MKNRIQKIVLMVVFLLTLTPLPLSAQATISEEPDFPEIKSDYVYMSIWITIRSCWMRGVSRSFIRLR